MSAAFFATLIVLALVPTSIIKNSLRLCTWSKLNADDKLNRSAKLLASGSGLACHSTREGRIAD
jgi:hypothetical protein